MYVNARIPDIGPAEIRWNNMQRLGSLFPVFGVVMSVLVTMAFIASSVGRDAQPVGGSKIVVLIAGNLGLAFTITMFALAKIEQRKRLKGNLYISLS